MNRSPELLKYLARDIFLNPLADIVCQAIEEEKLGNTPAGLPAFIQTNSLLTMGFSERLFNHLSTGSFLNRPRLTWNGLNGFVFSPDHQTPFVYVTAGGRRIAPDIMETTGGSTLSYIHSMTTFSHWEYAPAFIIHDWILTAHKCDFAPDNDFTFYQSSLILAEAMKTLMVSGCTDIEGNRHVLQKNPDFIYLVYLATRSCLLEDIWEHPSSVKCYFDCHSTPA